MKLHTLFSTPNNELEEKNQLCIENKFIEETFNP